MFTGIITDLGSVRAVEGGAERRFTFATGYDAEALAIGASVACSGVCLTVTDKGPGWFAAQASMETLSRTTMGGWRPGTPVNLERALAAGSEIGGHFVLGHVDAVARIVGRRSEGESLRFVFEAPAPLMRYIAPKGSVALDGVALTVNEVEGTRFGVNIVPHTWKSTTFGRIREGDAVNLEVDMLARYLEKLVEARAAG